MKKLILLCWLLCVGLTLADQGISSAAHAANQGRIVFSKEEIKFEHEDVSKFKQNFSPQEPIYGRLYLSTPLRSATLYERASRTPAPEEVRDREWEVQLYVDGIPYPAGGGAFAAGRVSDEVQASWTTWQFNLAPDRPELRDAELGNAWTRLVSGLAPGRHELRVVFHAVQGPYSSVPLAEGRFELELASQGPPPTKVELIGSEPPPSLPLASFPADSYSGSDLDALKQGVKKALVGTVFNSPQEIADIALTSGWVSGRYTHNNAEYRRIQATVLWASVTSPNEQRFASYSFIQTKQGNGWSALKLRGPAPAGPQGRVKR